MAPHAPQLVGSPELIAVRLQAKAPKVRALVQKHGTLEPMGQRTPQPGDTPTKDSHGNPKNGDLEDAFPFF